MANFKWEITDYSKDVLKAKDAQVKKALEMCGLLAEGYAKLKCPVDTGRLRNSITHQVHDQTMEVGTNVEYAIYIEMGTGKYAEEGGRQTSWVYKREDGGFVRTEGYRPHPYIRPSISEHIDEYKRVIKDELSN